MPNITSTTAAKYIAEAWTKEIEKPFYKALYSKDLVTRYDNMVTRGGTKLNVPFLSSYDARVKAAGTAVTFDANTETEIELSIDKHYYLALLIEDFANVQANYNLQEIYRGAQAEAVARAIDDQILALHGSAGTNISAGATLDDADMITVAETLDGVNVPFTDRAGIIHSEQMGDLRNVNKYTAYDQTGQKGVAVSDNPAVAKVYGFDLYVSNNVVEASSLNHNLFFHKKALGLAIQLKPTYKMEDSVDHIGMKTVLHTIFGVAVLRSAALIDVEVTA